MADIRLSREKEVFILQLGSGENRLDRSFIDDVNKALDEVEASIGPAALVTSAEGKFFSNGFDLEWMGSQERKDQRVFIGDTQALWARLVCFPMPTVAAINGHAFGAGAVHAFAHDFRLMHTERGYFCLPEVDLRLRFRPGMLALIQSKLTPSACRDAVLTGARFGAAQARDLGIVDEAVSAEELLPRAIARVCALSGKDRETYRAIKRGLYGPVFELLTAG